MRKNLNINEMQLKAIEMRQEMIKIYEKAGMGHITSGFSCMEMLVALYYSGIMKYDSKNPQWNDRDYFFMSKGHGSTALYPILADLGFFDKSELGKCTKEESILGICLNGEVPGVEFSSGSLAIAFGVSVGLAKALKLNRKRNVIFTMLGDAECYEGAIWESAMFAAHNQLNNLVVFVDRNYLGVTDFTENMVRLEPFAEKWKAFGWEVKEINGHRFDEILEALEGVHSFPRSKPLVIIADTVKGKGVEFIENVPLMHGQAVKGQAALDAMKELGDRMVN